MTHARWLLLAFALSLFAQAPPARTGGRGNTREFLGLGPAPDPVAADRGEKLYGPNCGFCHGAKANGAEGPDLVRSRSFYTMKRPSSSVR